MAKKIIIEDSVLNEIHEICEDTNQDFDKCINKIMQDFLDSHFVCCACEKWVSVEDIGVKVRPGEIKCLDCSIGLS